jgi:hypothetical protein
MLPRLQLAAGHFIPDINQGALPATYLASK